jgi:hypothetical protein
MGESTQRRKGDRPRVVHSFSIRRGTLDQLRDVAGKERIVGGMSAVVEDAVSSWLKRYDESPDWLLKRGVPAESDPTDDI